VFDAVQTNVLFGADPICGWKPGHVILARARAGRRGLTDSRSISDAADEVVLDSMAVKDRRGAVAHAGSPPLAKTAAGYRTTAPVIAVPHGGLL
jgi:hypothetical protein